jgi:hypothetical protein
MSERARYVIIAAIFAAVIAGIGLLIRGLLADSHAWKARCAARGGHTYYVREATTTMCLDATGRIIERP